MATSSQKKKKIVFVMIDGLADVQIPAYGFQTPLEHAKTPWMDAMAKSGANGLYDPVEPGLACGSDTAHLSILGYPPRTYYRGRGAFESMGAGLEMIPGDIAFKSNFATMDPSNGIVTRRRCDRNFEHWGPPLCNFLTGMKLPSFPEYQIDVKYATEHRCGVRVRGPNLTDRISDTDPLKDNLPLLTSKALEQTPEAELTAKLVNELSTEISKKLTSHPLNVEREKKGLPTANVVLLRGCGSRIKVPLFNDIHHLKAFMIAPTCIIAGLAMSLEIDIVIAPGGTGDYHTNLKSKAETLIKTISDPVKNYDFGFLHIKAIDDAGHDRNADLKTKFFERIDSEVLGPVISALESEEKKHNVEFTICLTGDHSTPVLYGDHSCEPVPFVITKVAHAHYQHHHDHQPSHDSATTTSTNPSPATHLHRPLTPCLTDAVDRCSEISACRGALGRFPGSEMMGVIKRFRDYSPEVVAAAQTTKKH